MLKRPFFGRFMVKWQNPLPTDKIADWQQITTPSESGGTIYGLFGKSLAADIKATIVLGHPMGKEAKGYFLKSGYADFLRLNGYNILAFDLNGFGESTNGNFSYYEDIISVSLQAKELTPDLPIGYHGVSLGGQWATISFADSRHCYDFAIIESAATTLDEFWIHFPFAYKALKVLNILMPQFRRKINMVERIKEAKKLKSILFIYSSSDNWTPVTMGERFKKNASIPSELWTVENAKHAQIVKSRHAEEYKMKILNYLDLTLKKIVTV